MEENSDGRYGSGLLSFPTGGSIPAGETKESPASAEQLINTEPKRFRKPPLPMLIAAAISVLLLGCVAFLVYLYFGMKPVLTHEYGYPLPDASAFCPERTCSYGFVPEDVDKKGLHRLTVTTDRGDCPVWILIRDTVAPAASAKPQTISTRSRLGPDELIEDLQDKDIVRVSFLETPPFGTAGDYKPVIILEDQSGNSRTSHVRNINCNLTQSLFDLPDVLICQHKPTRIMLHKLYFSTLKPNHIALLAKIPAYFITKQAETVFGLQIVYINI